MRQKYGEQRECQPLKQLIVLFAKDCYVYSNKTPNHMVYGDKQRYTLYIESTISALRYWLKLRKAAMTRFPKQTLTKLENDLDINASNSTGNWAGNIKHCSESYGFQDAWTDGVPNETSFLSAFERKMVELYQEECTRKYPIVTDFPPIVVSSQST